MIENTEMHVVTKMFLKNFKLDEISTVQSGKNSSSQSGGRCFLSERSNPANLLDAPSKHAWDEISAESIKDAFKNSELFLKRIEVGRTKKNGSEKNGCEFLNSFACISMIKDELVDFLYMSMLTDVMNFSRLPWETLRLC